MACCSKINYVAVSELLKILAEAMQETGTRNGNVWEFSYTGEGLAMVFEEDEYGRPLRVPPAEHTFQCGDSCVHDQCGTAC